MSLHSDDTVKNYGLDDFENKLKRKSNSWSFKTVRSEEDKRSRREVANNNERRRMQSINDGFENLRKLLPYCVEKDKISKASILQTTAKYIHDLKTRINCLENDLLQKECDHLFEIDDKTKNANDNFSQNCDKKPTSNADYTSDLGSSRSYLIADHLSCSTISLKSCDNEPGSMTSESAMLIDENIYQSQNSLDHLLAAVAQVERQEALLTHDNPAMITHVDHEHIVPVNCIVMKPTISPYTEEMIRDFVTMHGLTDVEVTEQQQQQHCANKRSLKISIPHKYLHRPDVVLSRSKN